MTCEQGIAQSFSHLLLWAIVWDLSPSDWLSFIAVAGMGISLFVIGVGVWLSLHENSRPFTYKVDDWLDPGSTRRKEARKWAAASKAAPKKD